jgi:uncharacterized protein YcnI
LPRPLALVAAFVCLSVPQAAAAHVVAMPAFLPSGSSESITFSGPNEREDPMTAFAFTVPDGVEIVHAHEVGGWEESISGSTATWTGGSLAPDEQADFGATLEAVAQPGVVELRAEQRYDDGRAVSWTVPLTILPAEDTPSQNVALAAVVGLLGLLVVAAIAMLAWRRRAS